MEQVAVLARVGNTEALVTVLERLTIALKSADQKAIAGQAENVPPDHP